MKPSWKRWAVVGNVFVGIALLLLLWDRSHYRLPELLEARVFPAKDWIYVPEEGSPGAGLLALRQWKERRAVHQLERADNLRRWEHFEAFAFAGEYFSCDNAIAGRWFLHFGEDGLVRTAVPGDKRFTMGSLGADFPVIDLGNVFADPTTYRRVDERTIEFSNAGGTWRFAMTPRLDEVDGHLENVPLDFCCDRIRFESLGKPAMRFELWRNEGNRAKFEFFRNEADG